MQALQANNADHSESLAEQVRVAKEQQTPLRIVGGDTKSRLGRGVKGDVLSTQGHKGIVEYAPTELVITARAGTLIRDVENALAENDQMLPFEPPHLGENATLGGVIACGLSGPRRPFAGAARDFVLGMRIINGKGEILNFGGQVMKNVAGYDVSRLMVGAQGTLGVLLDISLKVLPKPECEQTLVVEMDAAQAIDTMNRLAGEALPISAMCHDDEKLYLRLSAAEPAVMAAAQKIGGDTLNEENQFWLEVREQRLDFFSKASGQKFDALWRLSIPSATPPLAIAGNTLIDWGGAQRWLISAADAGDIHYEATSAGGYASLHHSDSVELPPLSDGQLNLQKNIKAAFDPQGILNPGRLYSDI